MPQFVNQPDSSVPLYLMNPAATPGLPASYQIGYWVMSPQSQWPTVPLSLANSWTSVSGVYLFMNATPSSITDFAAALEQLLSGGAYANARFLWIANPNDPLQSWQLQQIAATQPAGEIVTTARITFNNFTVNLGMGSTMALDGGGDGFTIVPPQSAPTILSFNVSGGASYTLTADGTTANLPFTGGTMGCLSFSMAVGAAPTTPTFFDAIDVGLQYFIDDDEFPGTMSALRYPVFSGQVPQQTLGALFDPINALLPLRTMLAFPTSGAAPTGSYFLTNIGQAITLTPASSTFTPYPPSLVLALLQTSNPPIAQANYYFAPAGSFTIGATAISGGGGGFTPPAVRVMCGRAGIEYLGLQASSGSLLHFWPGQAAYAPGALLETIDATATLRERAAARANLRADEDEALSSLAQTSWLYATPPQSSSVVYFAQPDDAALYGSGQASYLDFLEVPAGTLETSGFGDGVTPAFPMVPFAGVVAASLDRYSKLETQVLSPARRAQLGTFAPATPANGGGNVPGATPQGLLVGLDSTRTTWQTVTFAQKLTDTPATTEQLLFTNVIGGFQDALQSNQLFAVVTDATVVMNESGMQYEITDAVLDDLRRKRDPVPDSVLALLLPIKDIVYPSLTAFDTQLQTTLGSDYAQYHDVIEQYAPIFSITLDGWRFRLSPTMWDLLPDHPTMVVFKYANARLTDLAVDVNSWTWTEASGDVLATQDRLLGILEGAELIVAEAHGAPNDLDNFVKLINDPSWNGVVFLNANVPVTALPEELSALVSGIDPDKFFAHHFAVEITPVEVNNGNPTLTSSAISALISYNDPEDLFYSGDLYDFKVLSLNVLFRNSIQVNFSSRIELMTNAYFGELCTLQASEHNNNLILEGSAQRQSDGTIQYVFLQQGSNRFAMQSQVLQEVEITRTQFVTVRPPEGSTPTAKSYARFLLWGKLRWLALPGFDAFSFGSVLGPQGQIDLDGWLTFSGLSVDMVSEGTEDGSKTLTFNPSEIAFNSSRSVPRPQSLYAHFPFVVDRLLVGTPDALPKSLGFVPVSFPGGSGALGPQWYGLVCDVDLGTLGVLANQLGFNVAILAAWAPGGQSANVQLGLLLPGGRGLTSLIPIQGVIHLGFSSIDFTTSESDLGTMYMLRFRKLLLQVLSISFPPAPADLLFFTNPNNTDRSALGWYAAYEKD